MQLIRFLIIISCLAFIISCATTPPPVKVIPEEPRGRILITASWYGPKFHGRLTSSGERFNMYDLTAAHRTFKFGTKLRVTNPDNGKSVIVTVNDRGPFVEGRDLDLSYGAAKAIDFVEKGVGKVWIEYLGRDMRYAKRISFEPSETTTHLLTIQVGSFIDESNANRLKKGLEYKYDDVYITTVYIKGQKYHRVRVGKFSSYESAYSTAKKLAEEGYSTLIMTWD
jgi:rare lipoprotein A